MHFFRMPQMLTVFLENMGEGNDVLKWKKRRIGMQDSPPIKETQVLTRRTGFLLSVVISSNSIWTSKRVRMNTEVRTSRACDRSAGLKCYMEMGREMNSVCPTDVPPLWFLLLQKRHDTPHSEKSTWIIIIINHSTHVWWILRMKRSQGCILAASWENNLLLDTKFWENA